MMAVQLRAIRLDEDTIGPRARREDDEEVNCHQTNGLALFNLIRRFVERVLLRLNPLHIGCALGLSVESVKPRGNSSRSLKLPWP
jgi:hypothetical protein